jgi:quercetin dioxygenase-like cupin family protein
MEAVFPPGMQTAVHRHSGPEAWYLISGAQCLQMPDSTIIAHAGRGAVVPAGPPMRLTGMGSETRRSLVLVLHDAAQPWMTMTTDWTPEAKC